jgi:uncharacterized protein (TIGR02996 family)
MPTDPLAPPRPELLALLDVIKDNPDDDTPRLVLADWLDEQDDELDAERAQFIRAHIREERERTSAGHDPAARSELLERWLGPVKALGLGGFERGLPKLFIEGPRFLQPEVPALLTTEPFAFVQCVQFTQLGGARIAAVAAAKALRHFPGLYLHPTSAFGPPLAAKLLGSPNLSGLRVLVCCNINPGGLGLKALAANPALARLRKLSLFGNELEDRAIVLLANALHLTNLQTLDLNINRIGDRGAEALASSPHFANLRELDLRSNPRLTAAGKQRLREKFDARVKLD